MPVRSIRRRLTGLILALVTAVGFAFALMSYLKVREVLLTAAGDRIVAEAEQVADLLAQSAAARMADTRRLAADHGLQRLAATGITAEIPESLDAFLTRNQQALLWLHDSTGRATGPVLPRDGARREHNRRPPDALPADGVSALHVDDGRVWWLTAAPIPGSNGEPLGFLSVARPLGSGQGLGLIERLIGSGASLKVGNASGDVWTDLSAPVVPPPASSTGRIATFTSASGEARLGSAVTVRGTPWLVWIDVPEAAMLQPAASLLQRMVPVAIGLTALAACAVYFLSARVSGRLETLAHVADAIAAGDYSRRVPIDWRDEVGRAADALNLMAARVAESHEALEARVEQRARELAHARQELDHFFSLSLDLLCIAGTDGRFRRVNPAWEQTLGWSARDLTSAPYLDLVHPDDRDATAAEAAALAQGGRTVSFENRYRCKDGTYRWLSWKAAPLPDQDAIYAAAHDVTEQKRAALLLREHAIELESTNRELEAFSYSVSHDLRSPLRSIDGFSQALLEDYEDRLDETGRDFLSRIRAAAQRMGLLIDDLLSLSRVTRQDLRRSDLDVSALAADIAARLQEQDPNRRVEWRIEPGLQARGDSRMVRIALENLLSNAWKFTSRREDAVIEVARADLPEGGSGFVVRDNGAGFDMAHAGKLFGAFQRLHGTGEFPGTGIGLATVQRVVRRHGGTIRADASPGAGAAFTFTLEPL